MDSFGWSRRRAAWTAGGIIAAAGLPGALSSNWVGFLFAVFGQLVLIFGGLMLAVIAGYFWTAADSELARGFPHPGARRAWLWLLRTLVPAGLLIVLFLSVRESALPAWRALIGGG